MYRPLTFVVLTCVFSLGMFGSFHSRPPRSLTPLTSTKKGHVVCSIARSETKFIVEWLEYHLFLGYSHFYIYNQDDEADQDKLIDAVKLFSAAGLVTLISWKVGDQAGAYLDALSKYAEKSSTFTFLDVDEFIYFRAKNVKVWDVYQNLGLFSTKKCIALSWLAFGVGSNVTEGEIASVGVLTSLVHRASGIEKLHPGKVVLRGGANNYVKDFHNTHGKSSHGWHQCSGYARSKKRWLVAPPDVVTLAHFQFRHGTNSFIRRIERGVKGDFSGQEIYATETFERFKYRNEVPDTNLTASMRSALKLSQQLCECTGAHGQHLSAPIRISESAPMTSTKVLVYIHVATISRWRDILIDMLMTMKLSGLLSLDADLVIGVVGNAEEVKQLIFATEGRFIPGTGQVQIIPLSTDVQRWEIPSMNYLREFALTQGKLGKRVNVLYVHTKGAFGHGDPAVVWQWRKRLEHMLVFNFKTCLHLLDRGFDTVGVNAVNMFVEEHEFKMKVNPEHAWHYSGNFWWTTSSHLARLPALSLDHEIDHIERCKAENFILSALPDGMCAGLLHQDAQPHIYQIKELPLKKEMEDVISSVSLVRCRRLENGSFANSTTLSSQR